MQPTNTPTEPPKQLSDHYPTPKTYDEKRQERAEMNALHERRKPKYPKLQAAAIVAILALLALAWVALSPGLFSTPFPGVFIAALLGLIWFYVAYQGVKKIYSLMME